MSETHQLLVDFSLGKLEAFNQVYDLHARKLYSVCMRYSRCREDANDMLQETFIKIHAKMKSYQPGLAIEPWLMVITRNTALDFIRMNYKYELKENDHFFDKEIHDFEFEEDYNEISIEKILNCLHKLPDGYRMVFNLFYVDNLTHKEIASFLNISESTSKTQLMNAKKQMQKLLNELKELSYGNR